MKLMIVLMAFVFSGSIASAQSYSILGKGVMDKKTGDSIALACVEFESENTSQCKTISFVYFYANSSQTKEIGQRFSVVNDDLSAASNSAAKNLKKKIKAEYKASMKPNTAVGLITTIGILTAGGAATIALNTGLPVLAAFGVWVYLYHKNLDPSFMDPRGHITTAFLAVPNNQLGQAVLDHNSWNWSVKPKHVLHSRFKRILNALE